jgi:predicted nucleic acid-binding protein
LSGFVLDGSVTLAWALNESPTVVSVAAERLIELERATVPELWGYEVANVLALKRRRSTLDASRHERIRRAIEAYRVRRVSLEPALLLGPVTDLAFRHALTVYDAAYLFVAIDHDLPLATLDIDLGKAARAERVTLIGA